MLEFGLVQVIEDLAAVRELLRLRTFAVAAVAALYGLRGGNRR